MLKPRSFFALVHGGFIALAISINPTPAAGMVATSSSPNIWNWEYNGDGSGTASLSFSPEDIATPISTGTFYPSDFGETATFNYYLEVGGEIFSADDFSGVTNPYFIAQNGAYNGSSWTDIGENFGWQLTVHPNGTWETFDPSGQHFSMVRIEMEIPKIALLDTTRLIPTPLEVSLPSFSEATSNIESPQVTLLEPTIFTPTPLDVSTIFTPIPLDVSIQSVPESSTMVGLTILGLLGLGARIWRN